MGKTCCVLKCPSNKKGAEKVSHHVFPSDPDLRDIWVRNIGRPSWEPSPNQMVCSLHFLKKDYQTHSRDSSFSRERKRVNKQLVKLTLLHPDAVPTIFSNIDIKTD